MKSISLHPETTMSLKEFKKTFENHFLHILPEDRQVVMETEFDKIARERSTAIAEKVIGDTYSKITDKKTAHDRVKKDNTKQKAVSDQSHSENYEGRKDVKGGGK